MKTTLTAAIALSCAFPVLETRAAEIGTHPNDSPTLNAVSFTGEIVEGDAFRLKSHISRLPGKRYTAIYFNSLGGKFVEGLEIGKFLRRAGIRTVIQANGGCLSACAFAFLGGYDFYSKIPWRTKSTSSQLGFHSYFMGLDRDVYQKDEVAELLRASQYLALLSIEYFRDVEANFNILATALANGSNEMYFISNSEALEMGINIWDENRDEMVFSERVTRFTR